MTDISTRNLRRLIQAVQPGSWRDLSDVAVAELDRLGLFDAEAWEATEAGRAALAAYGWTVRGTRVETVSL